MVTLAAACLAAIVQGMVNLEAEKALAATRAADEIRGGMLVGLGTGTTASYAIRELGRRIAAGLRIDAVATSQASATLARSVGVPLIPFEHLARVDLTIDGVDEIDPALNAIKGRGGALLREKIVAAASDRMIVIADSSKAVERLGRSRVPVEVFTFASTWVERAIGSLAVSFEWRTLGDGSPFLTDQGNFIFDLSFGPIADPPALAAALDAIPGIVEHGLFLSEIDSAFIGRGGTVDELHRSRSCDEAL